MYRNPYEVEDNRPIKENKTPIDYIAFPRALPSSSNYPVHSRDFTDRNFVNGRKMDEQKPVQNSYIHRYHLHDLQQQHDNSYVFEQQEVDRFQRERPDSGIRGLERNFEDAYMHQNMGNVWMDVPQDTRNKKPLLNTTEREPMSRPTGGPVQYYKV